MATLGRGAVLLHGARGVYHATQPGGGDPSGERPPPVIRDPAVRRSTTAVEAVLIRYEWNTVRTALSLLRRRRCWCPLRARGMAGLSQPSQASCCAVMLYRAPCRGLVAVCVVPLADRRRLGCDDLLGSGFGIQRRSRRWVSNKCPLRSQLLLLGRRTALACRDPSSAYPPPANLWSRAGQALRASLAYRYHRTRPVIHRRRRRRCRRVGVIIVTGVKESKGIG